MAIFQSERSRKFIHIVSAAVFAALPYFLNKQEIIWASVLFLLTLLISRYLKLHTVDRQTLGELYFPIGVAISAYFFLPQDRAAFQFGILVLGLADAAAALVGKSLGRRRIKFFPNKTWEGSFAFFATTFALFLCLTLSQGQFLLLQGLLIALLLTVVEAISDWGLDNLFLPLVGAVLMAMVV